MAETKTRVTKASPTAFINQVPNEQKRQDARALVALMREITGHPPKMWGTSIIGFDRYHYTYESGRAGEAPLTGFSPRKQALVLYLGPGLERSELLAKLGKHKRGQGCLYVNTLADVDRDVLRELITASVNAMRERYPQRKA